MTTAVQPREHAVEARGLRFHYVEWGEPAAPAIVALHGMNSTCRLWDPFARAFQDRYRIIALDQRGHAGTSWPDPPRYTTDDFVGDLEALVDVWGLDRFVIVGLSMGGMNAMAYAARHPDKVTHLVPVDIPPAFNREKSPMRGVQKQVAELGHPTFDDIEDALKVARAAHPFTPPEALRHRLSNILKETPDGRWTYKQDPKVGYEWNPSNLWGELPNVKARVLIVRGGKSQMISDERAEDMQSAFPDAELFTSEEAGHTVPEDTPDLFIEAMEKFLAG